MIVSETSTALPSIAVLAHQTAKIETIQQKHGLPWKCGTVRKVVNPAYCREHLHDFPCNECTRPRVMGWDKEDLMPSGKCECCGVTATIYRKGGVDRCYHCHKTQAIPMELPAGPTPAEGPSPAAPDLPVTTSDVLRPIPRQAGFPTPEDDGPADAFEPSWDDFVPIGCKPKHNGVPYVSVQAGNKFAVSSALAETLGLRPGSFVLTRLSQDKKSLALKFIPQGTADARKLTPGRKEGRLAFGGTTIVNARPTDPGRYAVTITSWGVIVHLDRAA